MEKFIEKTLTPFLIIAGMITSGVGIIAVAPEIGLDRLFKLSYIPEYSIIARHWGMMVSLLGILMVVSAFKQRFILPVMIYCSLEKAFMVLLYIVNMQQSYSIGFRVAAVVDFTTVLYSLVYFYVTFKKDTAS